MEKKIAAKWMTSGRTGIDLYEVLYNGKSSFILDIHVSGRKYHKYGYSNLKSKTLIEAIKETEETSARYMKNDFPSLYLEVFCPCCGNIHSDGTFGNCGN